MLLGRTRSPCGPMACHATGVLIREHPATELTVATRILARADALATDGRITLRLHDVLYIAGRGVSNHTMTPYDVVALLLADGSPLIGVPPDDADEYVAAHRAAAEAGSVGRGSDGIIVAANTLRACAAALLARRRGEPGPESTSLERVWEDLVAEARVAGALIGAFPTDDATPG
jgi:ribulose-5-phosphate 4-epimerase/fuculose-1-phosphate aldolase